MSDSKPIARVARRIEAGCDAVFDAWVVPEWIGTWMFGPAIREEEVLHLKTDPVIGGTFSFLVRRGEEEIDHVGTYRVVERPNVLEFTWGVAGESEEQSVVRVEMRQSGTACEVKLRHEMDPAWAEYVDRSREAWAKMLGALARALEIR